jgi:hypothetical protein
MVLREMMEEIKGHDSFNVFWKYPEERNLWKIWSRLGVYRSPKEILRAVRQVCSLVFEENEEGSFLYSEAANLVSFVEGLAERLGGAGEMQGREVRDRGGEIERLIEWDNAVTDVVVRRYSETLSLFTEGMGVPEIEAHKEGVLYGKGFPASSVEK